MATTMDQLFVYLEDQSLPAELRAIIYDKIVRFDKIVVSSKRLSAYGENLLPQINSYFTLALRPKANSFDYTAALRKYIIHEKQAIKVIIADYDFNNIRSLLYDLTNSDAARKAMHRFCFMENADNVQADDDEGAHFVFHLHFSEKFKLDHAANVPQFFKHLEKVAKLCGGKHFRAFFQVDSSFLGSRLEEYIEGLDFSDPRLAT